jgi:integrase
MTILCDHYLSCKSPYHSRNNTLLVLRVSELLGLMWMDLDFEGLVIYVRRAYVWGRFEEPQSKASKAPVPMHPLLAGFPLAWRERTKYAKESDYFLRVNIFSA